MARYIMIGQLIVHCSGKLCEQTYITQKQTGGATDVNIFAARTTLTENHPLYRSRLKSYF